jgi:hypothetical protein
LNKFGEENLVLWGKDNAIFTQEAFASEQLMNSIKETVLLI